MVLCLLPVTALAANWNPDDKITIKVRIFNPDNGAYFVVGEDVCRKGDQHIQSDPYTIPALSKFIGDNSYRVERVAGNWYFPAGDRNVGSIVNWSCNSSNATMTYWVRGYNGASGGTGGGGTGTGSEESGSGQYSMSYTIVYHSNYPSGTDYTQTYIYTIYAGYNIGNTGRNVDIKSPAEVGFTAPAGFKIKSTPWNTKADGTGDGVNKLLYVKPNSTNHIYAQWEGEGTYYTITYKDGDNTVGTDAVLAGEPTTAMGALTKEGSTFKGWSETKGGTVKYSAGEEFTPNGNMTLYAVWENTAPQKPSDNDISNIVGSGAVNVECVTPGSGHGVKTYGLIAGSYDVGKVEGDATTGYTCDITVNPDEYVKAYNTDIKVNHTLASESQNTGTITLKWEPNLGNDGIGTWKVDRGVPVEFKVVCAPVDDPLKPEKPSDDDVKKLLGDVVTIDCTNSKVTHEDKTYGLLSGGFSVGDVQGDKEHGYTVNVTVTPDAYVTQYSKDIGEEHNLSPEGQDNLIITLMCAGKGSEWEIVPPTTKTYTVVCGTGVIDMVTVSFNSNGGTAVAPQTIAKGGKATKPANPTMDGYTFVNWYLDGEVYDFSKPVNENITLNAQWKKNDDNPGQDPNPDPSPKPSPKPNPGGHDHGGSTVVVPITVYIPPKTGDMPFWYSIAQFLGLVK